MEIIHGENDHCADAGKEERRIAALGLCPLHPPHFSVASIGQPTLQSLRMGGATGRGETAKGETGLRGGLAEFLLGHVSSPRRE